MKNLFIALLMSIAFVSCEKEDKIDCGTLTSKTTTTQGMYYLTVNGNQYEVNPSIYISYNIGDYVCLED